MKNFISFSTLLTQWIEALTNSRNKQSTLNNFYNINVTLWSGCTKQMIFLFVLAQNQRPELEISIRPEVGKGTPVRGVEKRNSEKAVGEGWYRGAVDTGQQKRPVGMR